MQIKKSSMFFLAGIILLLVLAAVGLGGDFPAFLRWYLTILGMGIGFYPMTADLFHSFADRGWLFSKTIGIAIGGYIVWVMVTSGVLKFTNRRSIVVTLILAGVCWFIFMFRNQRRAPEFDLILGEEFIFLAVFLMWTWFACFRPEASGTEKFMDFGFMAAMERSPDLPPKDIWYGLKTINYYYGGQYYGTYLAKLSYVPVKQAYNLYRMTVAAFAFVLPMSIVTSMLNCRLKGRRKRRGWALAGGLLAGAGVSLAGNMHYVLYGLLGPVLHLPGSEHYWFPDSTRYIGYNPETMDKCIHEFPSYSFILGDVHAHMANVMFVLTLIGVLYAWGRQVREAELDRREQELLRKRRMGNRPERYVSRKRLAVFGEAVWNDLREPLLLLASFFIGIFHWTNYWDFVIYFTVTVICIVFTSVFRYQTDWVQVIRSAIVHILEVYLFSALAALPFTLRFHTMVSSVAVAQNHTPFYQMMVLWGLPLISYAALIVCIVLEYEKDLRVLRGRIEENAEDSESWTDAEMLDEHAESKGEEEETHGDGFRQNTGRRQERSGQDGALYAVKKPGRITCFFRLVRQPDRFALILGLCAAGLLLIPELVYVRDIYENGYARANTMFKLTYQAFILFGMLMPYTFIRMLAVTRGKAGKIAGGILLGLFLLTLGYFPYSVHAWFGNVFDRSGFRGLDATAFVETSYPEDAGAIRWLDQNVKGQPIVLEAPGDSYSEYERVSAMTGLPTVLGWYVHEWLWRGDPEDLNRKAEDIQTIYTAADVEAVRHLVEKYDIHYIFVGSCEREKYPDLNEHTLMDLGDVVYREGSTYIIHCAGTSANGPEIP